MRIGITGTKTYENRVKIKDFLFKLKDFDDVTIIGLGEKEGADRYIKRFALEFGYEYKEANPPHTPQNLYSMLSEQHYNKPYSPRNFFTRNKIYAQYIDKCVVFDDSSCKDSKVVAIVNALTKVRKQTVIIN
jgi:hypothetical protein